MCCLNYCNVLLVHQGWKDTNRIRMSMLEQRVSILMSFVFQDEMRSSDLIAERQSAALNEK